MVFISLFFITQLFATTLPVLMTKQPLDQLRFISRDGKYLFSQKKNGILSYTNNYATQDIITKTPETQYYVSSSPSRMVFLIEAEEFQHNQIDFNKTSSLYFMKWGDNKPIEFAKGTDPKLHLQDSFISYYLPQTRELTFQNRTNPSEKTTIKLVSKHHHYFRPEVFAISQTQFYYTDINENGYSALFYFNSQNKTAQLIYKSPYLASRLELCGEDNEYLAIGEWAYDGANVGGTVFKINLSSKVQNTSYLESIYKSEDPDIGNMVCHNKKVFFIKTLSSKRKLNLHVTEVAEIDIKTTKVIIKSDLERVTQLLNLDGRILAPFKDKVYVLEGKSKLNDDRLKKQSVPNKEERSE